MAFSEVYLDRGRAADNGTGCLSCSILLPLSLPQSRMNRSQSVAPSIVTYNSGRFIRRCLESVLDHRYPSKEIIVVDNASTDGTRDILGALRVAAGLFITSRTLGSQAARTRALGIPVPSGYLLLIPMFC